MLSSVLDAFVDDDEEEGGSSRTNGTAANGSFCAARSGNSASAIDGTDGNNVTSGISPAANYTVSSRFASPPRRKRTDLVRLQMRCPTIVGAAVSETTATEDENDKEQQLCAQSLFVFPLPKASTEGVTRLIHTNTVAASHDLFTSDPPGGGRDDSKSRSVDTSIHRNNNTTSSVGLRLKTESEDSFSCGSPSSTAIPASRANASADSNRVSGGSALHYGTEAEGYKRGVAAAATTERAVTRYSSIIKEERDEEKQKENNSLATALGPDGVPLLKYEKGPFHVAEEAPMKEFRFIQPQPPTFASVEELNTTAASSEKGRGQQRGKTLLSMLPQPQHQQLEAVTAFSSSFVRSLKQRQAMRESSSSSNISNSSQVIGSATEADSHARNASSDGKGETANGSSSIPAGRSSGSSNSSSSSKTEASSWEDKDLMSRNAAGDSSSSKNMATVIQADEKKAKHRGEEARDSALSSLFSAYDDDEDETEENASPNAVGGSEEKLTHFERETTKTEDEGNETETRVATITTTDRLPLLGISFDAADEKSEPNDNKNNKSSGSHICFGLNLEQLVPGSRTAGENASAADTANLHNAGSLTTEREAYVNVWGDSETTEAELVGAQGPVIDSAWMGPATQQLHSEQSSQLRVAGMSLNEYRELQSARVKDVSGESLRDPDWQLNYQLHATPAHAKKTKLNISTNVWSVKDKGIVQTVEPRAMQKRKHQINWLAAEAAEKELEMWEMMAKTRQNKYNTAMKYGW